MIKIWYKNGRYAPVIVCDICGGRIEDAASGAAVGPQGDGSGVLLEVLHVHKGRCHEEAEAKLGGKNVTGWDELQLHLLNLGLNFGLTPKKAQQLLETSDEAGL